MRDRKKLIRGWIFILIAIFPLAIGSVIVLFKTTGNFWVEFILISIGIIILFVSTWQQDISQKKP